MWDTSLIAAKIVGEEGEVHSFEPNRRIFQLFKASIAANALRNICVNPFAVWSRQGTLVLTRTRDSGFSFVQPTEGCSDELIMKVQAITLDQYTNRRMQRPVRLIKIDVEGAELHVLKGARKLLQFQAPSLIVEAQDWSLHRFGHKLEDLFGIMKQLGYHALDLYGVPIRDAEGARQRLQKQWAKNIVFEKGAVQYDHRPHL